ncbi:hypothetical protein B0H19DRAFT_1257825 [Mycena capillaripes]|nr:hypothetical protein B0H19DRAFT_1257825 [Mycena capillaripes]
MVTQLTWFSNTAASGISLEGNGVPDLSHPMAGQYIITYVPQSAGTNAYHDNTLREVHGGRHVWSWMPPGHTVRTAIFNFRGPRTAIVALVSTNQHFTLQHTRVIEADLNTAHSRELCTLPFQNEKAPSRLQISATFLLAMRSIHVVYRR